MATISTRLRRLERELRRRLGTGDDDVLLIVFDESEITDAQRRKSERTGTPILVMDMWPPDHPSPAVPRLD